MARIAILTCHLSGTGHLVRMIRLARAAQALGHRVRVLSGGRPLDHLQTGGVQLVQLPPIGVQGLDFATLRDPGGTPVTPAYMQVRRTAIAQALTPPPDVLITETFPLGRRMLADEFLTAIAAVPDALILSSVRDIPEPKPKRLDQAAQRLKAHYHGVLVHGDAALIGLDATWPLPDDLRRRVHHTGYIAPDKQPSPGPRGQTVVVTGGGGVLGRDLLATAAQAAALDPRPWHLLVGGADRETLCHALTTAHGRVNLTIEPVRPDYLDLLHQAACSVSLCGYNTAVELAGLTVPAVLVPSTQGGEQEQTLRARAMAGHEGVQMLDPATLTPEQLARTVAPLAAGGARPPIPLTADDGTGAIRCIETLLERR